MKHKNIDPDITRNNKNKQAKQTKQQRSAQVPADGGGRSILSRPRCRGQGLITWRVFIYRARGISPAARPPTTVQSRCSLLLICVTGLLLLLLLLLARHAETLENKTARSMAIRRCCRAQSPSFVLQSGCRQPLLHLWQQTSPDAAPPVEFASSLKVRKESKQTRNAAFFWFSFFFNFAPGPGCASHTLATSDKGWRATVVPP